MTGPTPDDEYVHVPASSLLPADRVYQAPEGFRIIPTDNWIEGQGWWPLGYLTTRSPFSHPPKRTDRTHVLVRDTPATERVPWHAAVGRTLPDGRKVHKAGISPTYPNGAVSTDVSSIAPVYWLPADDDGTVEVRTTTREVTP